MNTPKTINKEWGKNHDIGTVLGVSVAVACIEKGKKSSEHFHPNRVNRFVLLTGKLQVKVWLKDDLRVEQDVRIYELDSMGTMDIKSGIWHQFHAIEDSVLLECYWPDVEQIPTCCEDDIVRRESK